MTPLRIIKGAAAVLPIANIDTDVIIRIERLTAGDDSRLGEYAFEGLRFRSDGSKNPDFPLNRKEWRGAPILLAGENFGCGSSREGAVLALAGMGIRCIIAPSFGEIFHANCFQNGILPIRLNSAQTDLLMTASCENLGRFAVDLAEQTIRVPGIPVISFEVDAFRKAGLLAGLDDIGITLEQIDIITRWQERDRLNRPWVWDPMTAADELATSTEIKRAP